METTSKSEPCQECKRLRKRINELESELEETVYASSRAREDSQRAVRDARRKADEAAAENEDFRARTVRELERSRDMGDTYGVDRALSKLKRGW